MEQYYEQAVACVKDFVLPQQRENYERCGRDLDRVYGEEKEDDCYTGKVIEPGHVYELGYKRCICKMVLSGQVADPEHCECTKQSILYILQNLEPDCQFKVEILETILRGGTRCRFRITR